jgi:hypothetical protein
MSACDADKKRTVVDLLGNMGTCIDELKDALATPDKDVECEDKESLSGRVTKTYDRMKSGVRKREGLPDLPGVAWFRDCVTDMVKIEVRVCRDIAKRYGAEKTREAINKRLDSYRR